MSRYYDDDDDDYRRNRGRRSSPPRDRSPDFFYAGGAPPAFASGAMPAPSQARIQYEPQTPFYPPPPTGPGLLPPSDSRNRPRSMPPPGALAPRHRRRSGSRSPSTSSQERDRPRTPLGKAKHALKDTFTDSTSGVGVGVLGAIVGGLVAREASEHASRRSKSHHGNGGGGGNDNARIISTIVGAAVGGLGANALEKRLEVNRKKGKEEQHDWDRKWRPDRARDRDDRIRGRRDDDYDDDDDDYTYEDRRLTRRRSEDRHSTR